MSNARNLANLLGTSTTVPASSLSLTSADMPAGSVLQVVSTERTDADSWLGMGDIFSLNITPISASSKIFIQFSCVCSATNRYNGFKLFRDATQIALGDSAGTRARIWCALDSNDDETNQVYLTRSQSASYLDSPATTSQITYKVQGGNFYTSYSFYLNRAGTDTDNSYLTRGSTNLILMEIAG